MDGFPEKSGITPEATFYKGRPKLTTKPDGPKRKYSGCALPANDADVGEFNKQVEDVVNFLTTNYSKLKYINSTPKIQFASLDFEITYDSGK
ncbi:hypothetical protein A0256_04765 [Mucilaginibacter sp. PAMC 26640]|nr:hypothetical protein A0256_04765 [Mucilaginibacter sp. PAMC 26640]